MKRKKITIDCISDLHGHTPKMPGGDLLLVAGDLTKSGTMKELVDFRDNWLLENEQKYKKIILISGNHDRAIRQCFDFDFGKSVYLCDGGFQFEGLKIWGTPWSLTFDRINLCCAEFTGTEEELSKHFAKIPDNTNIVVVHGPPFGMKDWCNEKPTGCWFLNRKLISLKKLKLVVFGHIHEQYGTWTDQRLPGAKETQLGSKAKGPITYVNASHVNKHYQPVNQPIRIKL